MSSAVTERSALPAFDLALPRSPSPALFTSVVALLDLAVIVTTLAVGTRVFPDVSAVADGHSLAAFPPGQTAVATVIAVAAWGLLLRALGTYRLSVISSTGDQNWAVVLATLILFAGAAVLGDVLDIDWGKGFFAFTLPVGLAMLLIGRRASRRLLLRLRRAGRLTQRCVILTRDDASAGLTRTLTRAYELGLTVVASVDAGAQWSPSPDRPDDTAGILAVMQAQRADVLLVDSLSGFNPQALRALRWALEGADLRLALVTSLTGVGAERVSIRHVDGLAELHIHAPSLGGPTAVVKRGVDLVLSTLAIALLLPVLAVIAVLIKAGDGGPVLFRQRRVGLRGSEFTMLKFRTMVVDAEARLAAVQAQGERDAGNDVMFKMTDDPRITRVGRVLRRFSLDELPQLFNVWGGTMSLVGPRPPLAREVALYEDMVHRKFMVKPGITGLWQTSGRSTLSWDDSVDLDLFYVENVTLARDLRILVRTVRAVTTAEGAY